MAAAESPAQGDLLATAPLLGRSRGDLPPLLCDQGLRLSLTYGDLQRAHWEPLATASMPRGRNMLINLCWLVLSGGIDSLADAAAFRHCGRQGMLA